MMTRLQKAVAIIALGLCFAAAVAGELWDASHPPNTPQQRSTSKTAGEPHEEATKENAEQAIAKYNYWLTLVTFILAVATTGLGIIGIYQIRLARAEFIASYRPRLILRNVYQIAESVEYLLVNIGDTKATIIESAITIELMERDNRFAPLRTEGRNDIGRIEIAAGEAKELSRPLPGNAIFWIKWPEARRIGIEGAPIAYDCYFVGVIIYADDLGVRRRSIFRRIWSDHTLTFLRLAPDDRTDHEYSD